MWGRTATSHSGASSGSAASDAGGQKQESDRIHEETGEYDTQDKYKRVGNPIQWANPTGGGTTEDNSSKHWRWVYPVGATLILLLCLNSRRKSLKREQEEAMMQASQINMPDTSSFT